MFTDIVNSTLMKGKMSEETSGKRDDAFHHSIKVPHEKIIFASLAEHGGKVIEGTGDGYFIAFEDPEEAVLCAVEIQERLTATAIPTPLGPLQVRVGVHSGRAKPHGTAYTASAADKAARVQSKVEGGLVFLSAETHVLVTGKITTLAFTEVGEFDLKGLGTFPLYQAFRSGKNPVAAVEDKYHQHLIDRFGKLSLYSLSSDQPIAVDLEQVFVKLTTTEKQTLSERDLYPDDLTEELATKDRTTVPQSEGTADIPPFHWFRAPQPVQETTVTLTLPAAVRAHAHLAIIGAPGAGKTTALKWLALAYARRQVKERLELDEDRLPLFVTLRDFNRFLDNLEKSAGLPGQLPPGLLARHLQEYYAEHVAHLHLPADFFIRALATGRALVLLDGLDEVAVAAKRARAAEFVVACVRAYPGCRFVLTSRPRGYENDCRTHLAVLCSECRVRDFDDDDIAAFSRNWYLAVTVARAGDNPTTRDQAESAAKNRQAAVKQERVRPLAANPLLLSILALIHQKGVGLPQRRVELYQECTEFLLGYWDATRGGDVGRELAELGGWNSNVRRKLLEPIALWMQGRGENRTQVHRDELIPKLAEQFGRYFVGTPEQSTLRAEEFVNVITLRTGLLLPKEENVFEFAHPTFREYFAACAMMARKDYISALLAHLHDPWWNEVHLLGIGHIGTGQDDFVRERVQTTLEAIRNARSWLESDLHRDLLFAFHALSDVGPLRVETVFRQELTQTVFDLWWKTESKPLQSRIAERFSYAGATPVGNLLVEILLPLTMSKTANMRARATRALGRLGGAATTPAVLARLLALSHEANADMRASAASALGGLGSAAATPAVLARLLALIQDGNDAASASAADALGRLGGVVATSALLAWLLESSQDTNDAVRLRAASALGGLGSAAATPAVLARLVELSQDSNKGVHDRAVGVLGGLGGTAATPTVLTRLLELSQDANVKLRYRATNALGHLGSAAATPTVLTRLVALSQDDDDVRYCAAEALGRLGRVAATPVVLARLLDLSQDHNNNVRSRAASVLGGLGSAAATPAVLARLLDLSQDYNENVRSSAAGALGQMTEALKPEQVESLAAWCRTNLANYTSAAIGGNYQSMSQAAFDILHRLAAQRALPGPA